MSRDDSVVKSISALSAVTSVTRKTTCLTRSATKRRGFVAFQCFKQDYRRELEDLNVQVASSLSDLEEANILRNMNGRLRASTWICIL